MRLIKITGLLVCLAVLTIAGVAAQDQNPIQEQGTRQAQWLFVLHGDVRSVSEGQMVLAAEPKVIAFTDRPNRQVRIGETGAFIDMAWAEGSSFRQDPPNAAMTSESSDETSIIVIEDVKRQGGSLALTYSDLSGSPPEVGEHVAFVIDFNWNNNIP